ncbi:energy transducer TonB [Mucilaginibacter myungsuensis]|uniref:Energy transducer TonB n=1 Tax=Mucilaginibacter myungsuensis TaxID=649104 RepID=A0A929KZP1_9SPHI|nr:energy transducer TonB [Mucilaginibacter myungsuensis]MBE9660616.1 energy transducer TonB [Mucilaginibacter myungsuensis]MDN3600661.1 energy transducer TonB [Mucilaginibacter myungsuensis]
MRKNLIAIVLLLTACAAKAQSSSTDTVKTNTSATAKDKPATDDNEIYSTVEEQAEFPGGIDEFMNFLYNNVRYPMEDRMAKRGGKVFVQFVIEKNGSLSQFKIIKSVSKTIDQEAIRVIKSSPKWKPAKEKGVIVRQLFTAPFAFSTN